MQQQGPQQGDNLVGLDKSVHEMTSRHFLTLTFRGVDYFKITRIKPTFHCPAWIPTIFWILPWANQKLSWLVKLSSGTGKWRSQWWKRLRHSGGIQLCQEIFQRHGQYDYVHVLEQLRSCFGTSFAGFRVLSKNARDWDSSSSNGWVVTSFRFLYITDSHFFSFIKLVATRVFPIEFSGCPHNLEQVLSRIKVLMNGTNTPRQHSNKIYFSSVDIQHCYDNINKKSCWNWSLSSRVT